MGKNDSSKHNDGSNQPVRSNRENLLNVNAPGGVSIQILGMDIRMSDLNITLSPDANINEIQSIIDQLNRRG